MKLYEFTLTANKKLSESKLLEHMDEIAAGEATIQGWKTGYTVTQCSEPQQLFSGGVLYSFAVQGELLDAQGTADSIDDAEKNALSISAAARSPEVEL